METELSSSAEDSNAVVEGDRVVREFSVQLGAGTSTSDTHRPLSWLCNSPAASLWSSYLFSASVHSDVEREW